jgi:hypothetical protein
MLLFAIVSLMFLIRASRAGKLDQLSNDA